MPRANLQIEVGTYTGNGLDNRLIELGYQPDSFIVRGASSSIQWKHRDQDWNSSMVLHAAPLTGTVRSFTPDGVVVSNSSTVNANATAYHYMAIKANGSNHMAFGSYIGNATDNRDITDTHLIGFTPTCGWIKNSSTNGTIYRTENMTTDTSGTFGSGPSSDRMQSFFANGFQAGASAAVNGSGLTEYYWFFRNYPGVVHSGSYTGNGTSQSITGIGFRPDFVVTHASNATTTTLVRFSTQTGADSFEYSSGAAVTDGITSLDDDGFTVGANLAGNTDAVQCDYFAFKAGTFNLPITRNDISY